MLANKNHTPKVPNIDRKIWGCWRGKVIGGTLGAPYEGCPHKLKLEYYQPLPRISLANDDLDIQVLWAQILTEHGFPVNSQVLAQAWLDHIDFPWDEYGVALRNIKMGILPPASGIHDNFFTDGLGAAIRSELWACLAAGNPDLAAKLAYEDACIDHAGNGIYIAQFLAALESAAFINSNVDSLIDTGLKYIPDDCKIATAIKRTRQLCSQTSNWDEICDQIMSEFGSSNFTDVSMNVSFIILGLLLGKKDFDQSLCYTVNCGQDTDCTSATVGAILGILLNDDLPYRWQIPIGDKLVISKEIRDISLPKTITEFAQQVLELHYKAQKYYASANLSESSLISSYVRPTNTCTIRLSNGSDATIAIKYPPQLRIRPDRIELIELLISSTSHKTIIFDGQIIKPDGWILHSDDKFRLECINNCPQFLKMPVSYTAESIRSNLQKLQIKSFINGSPYNFELPLMSTMPWRLTTEPPKHNVIAHTRKNERIFESTGFWISSDLTISPGETCRLQQSFLLESAGDIIVAAICNFDCSVWIDESLIIQRSNEELFIPSFHRCSDRSRGICKLSSGWHSWEIAVCSPQSAQTNNVVLHIGLADLATQQWLKPKAWSAKAIGTDSVPVSNWETNPASRICGLNKS